MRLKCMQHASLERARDEPMQVQKLMIKLQQDVRECHAPFLPYRDACGTCPQDAFEMRAGRVWDTCEHYLEVELFCEWIHAIVRVLFSFFQD